MKITGTESQHKTVRTTHCTFELDDVAPMTVTSYGVREFQPRTAAVRIDNGRITSCHLSGPAIIKAGLGSERTRTFYEFERKDVPWLADIEKAALAEYRKRHGQEIQQ